MSRSWTGTRYPGSGGGGGQLTLFFESAKGVELRLHTENQRPRCPGSGLKVCVSVCV